MGSYRANRNEQLDMQEEQKTQEEKNAENNANTIKNATDVAIATKNPYAMAAGYAVKGIDKLTGGKASQGLGKAMSKITQQTPGGKQIQNISNKLSESGVGDKVGQVASMKNQTSNDNNKGNSVSSNNLLNNSSHSIFANTNKGFGDILSNNIFDFGKLLSGKKAKIIMIISAAGFLFIILIVAIVLNVDLYNLSLTNNTSLTSKTGISETIGDFKLFYQTGDTSPFAGSTIEKIGCGPVVMAMILTNLLDRDVLPSETAKYALDNGHVIYEGGVGTSTSVSLLTSSANSYGVQNDSVSVSEDSIKSNLSQGKLMVLLVGPGTFTSQNHFIVLRGLSQDGTKVAVADPLSSEKSNTLYDFNTLISEGKNLYSFWV